MGLTIKTSDIRKAINEVISSKKAQRLIKEAMYRNMPGDGEDFPPFSGRRPKTVKARINQIYSLVSKYGLSSRKYTDDHWQATDDYDRILRHLGYEVHWDVKDGGYGDYRDGRPMSKTYGITLVAEDGMEIEGYIKCMAAGSVEDPFDAYDTCMVLWNKPKRSYNESITAQSLRNLVRESIKASLNEWDADDPDEGPEDDVYRESPSKEYAGVYDLDTDEIFEYENTPDIEINSDELGGVHKYVHFWATPGNYSISSEDDTYDSPGYWDCDIKDYDISTDGIVYLTTVYENDGIAMYDDETPSENFGGFSEEQKNKISRFVDENCGTDYWDFR